MEVIARASVVFFFVFFLTRVMGKRELAEMTAFELILFITIGDLVQQGVTQEDMSVTGSMLASGTIGLWIIVLSYVSWRSPAASRRLEGTPVVIVHNGRILEEPLRYERVSRDEVIEAARQHGIDDIASVALGVIEPDGRISLIERGGDGDRGETPEKHKT